MGRCGRNRSGIVQSNIPSDWCVLLFNLKAVNLFLCSSRMMCGTHVQHDLFQIQRVIINDNCIVYNNALLKIRYLNLVNIINCCSLRAPL